MADSTVDVTLYMSIHVGDRLRETGDLSPAEYGSHVRLTEAAWQRGGSLPAEPARLCRLAGAAPADWPAIWAAISPLWTVEGEQIHHAPTLAALERARAAKLRAVAAGRAGGSAPHPTQRRADVEQPSSTGRADVEQTPSKTSSTGRAGSEPPVSGIRDPGSGSPDTDHQTDTCPGGRPPRRARARRSRAGESEAFARVYQAYPRHIARARAAKAWTRQARDYEGGESALEAAVMAALAWQLPLWKTDEEYPTHVPFPSTYLADERWTDDPQTAPSRRADGRPGPQPQPAYECLVCRVTPCRCTFTTTPAVAQ